MVDIIGCHGHLRQNFKKVMVTIVPTHVLKTLKQKFCNYLKNCDTSIDFGEGVENHKNWQPCKTENLATL